MLDEDMQYIAERKLEQAVQADGFTRKPVLGRIAFALSVVFTIAQFALLFWASPASIWYSSAGTGIVNIVCYIAVTAFVVVSRVKREKKLSAILAVAILFAYPFFYYVVVFLVLLAYAWGR